MAETDPTPRTSLKRSASTRALLALAVGVAALAAGGVWLWLGRAAREPDAPPAPAPAATAPEAPAAEAAPDAPAAPVDPADVRALLEEASPNAAYRRWLAEPGLLERCAVVIENVATGASPAEHLPFLKPAAAFSVAERDGRTVIAPESYRRYDATADAVQSLDASALARAWRALHPALDAAYRALGYPRGALDLATTRALQRIAAAPVVDGDVAVVDEGGVWLFDDPALERRGEVEKHLLRMGPRNTRLLQAKAREIHAALGLPASVAPASAR